MSKGLIGIPSTFIVSVIVVTFLFGVLNSATAGLIGQVQTWNIDQQLESMGDDLETACMEGSQIEGNLDLDAGYEEGSIVQPCGDDLRSICFDRNVYTPDFHECAESGTTQVNDVDNIEIEDSTGSNCDLVGEEIYIINPQYNSNTGDYTLEITC